MVAAAAASAVVVGVASADEAVLGVAADVVDGADVVADSADEAVVGVASDDVVVVGVAADVVDGADVVADSADEAVVGVASADGASADGASDDDTQPTAISKASAKTMWRGSTAPRIPALRPRREFSIPQQTPQPAAATVRRAISRR
ncbi:MAG: hypothetical protein OXN44_08635 [Acidimicrobiaceae bacterium]|nr:hypothetical protein [Acidimicrobiaceae bacterium]